MRFLRPLTVAAVLVLAQLSAFAGQIAVLRNGFSIHFDRKEQIGNATRLYSTTGYLDVASDQITSFEEDEAPVASEQPTAVASATQLANPAVANKPFVNASLPTQPSAGQPLFMVSKSAVVPPVAVPNIDLDEVVREASSKNHLDPDFVSSVIRAESN